MSLNTRGTLDIQTSFVYIIKTYESFILDEWFHEQFQSETCRLDLMHESEVRQQSKEFLDLLVSTIEHHLSLDIHTEGWRAMRNMLDTLSSNSALKGFTPSETLAFIFSLKHPLFTCLKRYLNEDGDRLVEAISEVSLLLDRLGLYVTEAYQKNREEIILRQQEEIHELSTPVLEIWRNILAIPLIGTLDSSRAQQIMKNLLEKISAMRAEIAIIDITGVPTVDTMVAQHLLKTVAAARLMGAMCIISGISPEVAQTMVTMGVSLDVVTKARLSDALALAFERIGLQTQCT